MSYQRGIQLPLATRAKDKRDMRAQFAALCYRVVNDKTQILLITSRGRKRWIVPKGWPSHGVTPAEGAAIEAWEEAGVKGRAFDQCLGVYSYVKLNPDKRHLACVALVYPVKVKKISDVYPEAGQRRRKWVRPSKAAAIVHEPELKEILRNFDPRLLRG